MQYHNYLTPATHKTTLQYSNRIKDPMFIMVAFILILIGTKLGTHFQPPYDLICMITVKTAELITQSTR